MSGLVEWECIDKNSRHCETVFHTVKIWAEEEKKNDEKLLGTFISIISRKNIFYD